MIYFTSDLHFYHEKIIHHCNRPFRDAQEMNEKLIQNWNSIVAMPPVYKDKMALGNEID